MSLTDEMDGEMPARPVRKPKSMVARILPPLLVLLVLAGGAFAAIKLDLLAGSGLPGFGPKAVEEKETIVEVPQLIVTLLDRSGRRYQFGMTVQLVARSAPDAAFAQAKLPLVKDVLNAYLRELRPDDLKERGGISRLRQEIVIQLNATLKAIELKDLLIKDMLIQQSN